MDSDLALQQTDLHLICKCWCICVSFLYSRYSRPPHSPKPNWFIVHSYLTILWVWSQVWMAVFSWDKMTSWWHLWKTMLTHTYPGESLKTHDSNKGIPINPTVVNVRMRLGFLLYIALPSGKECACVPLCEIPGRETDAIGFTMTNPTVAVRWNSTSFIVILFAVSHPSDSPCYKTNPLLCFSCLLTSSHPALAYYKQTQQLYTVWSADHLLLGPNIILRPKPPLWVGTEAKNTSGRSGRRLETFPFSAAPNVFILVKSWFSW